MAREYDGKSSAARWLTKLRYDFEQSGQVPPPPPLYLKAIDMLFVSDAATCLNSTPQMRYIVNNKAAAIVADVKEFEDALKKQFLAALTTVLEISARRKWTYWHKKLPNPLQHTINRLSTPCGEPIAEIVCVPLIWLQQRLSLNGLRSLLWAVL